MATLVSPTTIPVQPREKLWRFRLPALLVTLVMGLTGGHNLVTGWSDPLDGGIHRVQDLHWGVAEGLFLAMAMGLQLRHPTRHPGAMRVAVLAMIGQLVVALATANPDPFGIALFVLVALATIAHPARRQVLRPTVEVDNWRLALAAPTAVALGVFAAVQVTDHWQAVPGDLLVARTGYIGAAISCLGVALICVAAAVTASRVTTMFASVGLGILGVASLLHPHLASSFGAVGGILAVIAAAATAAIDLRTGKRAAGS